MLRAYNPYLGSQGFPEAVISNRDCKGDWELATGGSGGRGRNIRQQGQHVQRPRGQGGMPHIGGSGRNSVWLQCRRQGPSSEMRRGSQAGARS